MIMVLVTKIIGLIYKVPLTTMLGGSGMSCYSGAFAVFTPVFAAAAAGVPSAMSRLISEQLALGRYRSAVRIKNTALLLFSAVAIVLSAGLIVSADYLAVNVIHSAQAKWAVIAVSLSLFPAAVMNVQRGWAEGLGSMTPTASSEIAETIFKLIFGLALPYLVIGYAQDSFMNYHGCFGKYCSDMQEVMLTSAPYAAAASALGVSAASFVACIFIFVRTRRLSRTCAREFADSSLPLNISRGGGAKRLLKFAVPASLTALVATLASMADLVTIAPQLDNAMKKSPELFSFLSAYGIPEEERGSFVYGSYTGLALTIFGLLPTFTAMLGKSALPSLTSAFARGNKEESGKCVRSMLLLSSGLALPGGLGICVLAKPLLNMFFGGSTAEIAVSSKPLAILGIAVVFMGISMPCMTALQACSRQIMAVVITLTGTGLKLVLNIVLIQIPQLNICGAALATAISQAVMCVWSAVLLIRCSGAGAQAVRSITISVLPALLCSSAAILVQQHVIMRFDGISGRLGVLVSVAIGAIICLISFTLLCISPKNQIIYLFSKKIPKTP